MQERRLEAAGVIGLDRQAGRAVHRQPQGEHAMTGLVPAPRDAVERVRSRTDRLVRAALPVHEVVTALVTGPAPVGDLVAAIARRAQSIHGQLVVLGRAVIGLLGDRGLPPATSPRSSRQVIAQRTGQPLAVRIVQRERIGRDVVRDQRQGRIQSARPGLQ